MNLSTRCTRDSIPFNSKGSVRQEIRRRVCAVIDEVLDEELEAALGAARHERTNGRAGYRNGTQQRTVVTERGPTELNIPRGRLFKDGGGSEEWRSELLPRYQRRTAEVDEAVLGSYLAGTNTRRIRQALKPLLGDTALSKSAVSRIVARLKKYFDQWSHRDLAGEHYLVVYLDAMRLPIRMAANQIMWGCHPWVVSAVSVHWKRSMCPNSCAPPSMTSWVERLPMLSLLNVSPILVTHTS